jgi:hypothetical protein
VGRLWITVVFVAAVVHSSVVDGADTGLAPNESRSDVLVRPPAPARLPDIAAIRAWAEKASWGGHEVDVFKSDGRQVAVARRSFTSGVETCGLTVFVPTSRGWEPGLTLDVTGFWLKVSQEGDSIRTVNSNSKAEVARFSVAQLQANKALQTDGASRRR